MLQLKSLLLGTSFCLIFNLGYTQEVKNVSNKLKNDYFTINEKFSVLKDKPEIKQGPYSASISSYSEKGQYNQGNKTGVWEYYDGKKLIQKYDFATQTFLQEDAAKSIVSVKQLDDQGNVVKELGPRNAYLGGDAKTWQILKYSIRYPAPAQENDIQGLVVIEAKINKHGKLTSEKAITSNGYGLEEEALRVFKLLPPDWVPVVVDGKPVDAIIQVKISFRLSHLPPFKT